MAGQRDVLMKVSELTSKKIIVGTSLLRGHEGIRRQERGLTGTAIKFVAAVRKMSKSGQLFTTHTLALGTGEGLMGRLSSTQTNTMIISKRWRVPIKSCHLYLVKIHLPYMEKLKKNPTICKLVCFYMNNKSNYRWYVLKVIPRVATIIDRTFSFETLHLKRNNQLTYCAFW